MQTILSEEECIQIIEKTFDEISQGSSTINFIPTLVANDQFDGGLGPVRFKEVTKCGLSNAKLLGETPVSKQEFVQFYLAVLKIVPRLKFGAERLPKAMTKLTIMYKVHSEDVTKRVSKLVKLFKAVDKDLSGTLQREELTQHAIGENEDEGQEKRVNATFNWVDRNQDGTVSIFELIGGAMNKTMMELPYDAWQKRLQEIGLRVDKV